MRHSADFERLWIYSVGFYGVWVAHIGRQNGLFDRLAASPVTIDNLATITGFYKPAVHAWCSAALAYGLINKKNGKLYLRKNMKALLLDKKDKEYLGGQFSYLALRSLEYGGFDDLFKYGKTRDMSSTFDAIQQATDWDHYAFISAIRHTRKDLHLVLSQGCRLLDIGCGTGGLLAKLCEEYPRSSYVGIDPSEKAVKKAMKLANGSRVTVMKQSGENMQFSDEFDVAYFGESLYAAKDKQRILSNCYRALKKGGIVAIVEGLLPPAQSDENKLIMGMQLDFILQGYQFMSAKELTRLLRGSGFNRINFTDFGGSVYLITARKY